jgi:hypothetical protein
LVFGSSRYGRYIRPCGSLRVSERLDHVGVLLMKSEDAKAEFAQLAEELGRRMGRGDGLRVAGGLDAGLTLLRKSLYARLHEDVERMLGKDSMFMPVSEVKAEIAVGSEIELFQIAESAAAARDGGYCDATDDFFADWLTRLRLGQTAHRSPQPAESRAGQRIADYLAQTPDGRRLAFSTVLARALPESQRAPLVLFQLYPLAVQIVTAAAFADGEAASAARRRQIALLPAIVDCRSCHGKVLDSGEQCPACGNPLWKPEWLTDAD